MKIIIALMLYCIASMLLGNLIGYYTDDALIRFLFGAKLESEKVVKLQVLDKTVIFLTDERKMIK